MLSEKCMDELMHSNSPKSRFKQVYIARTFSSHSHNAMCHSLMNETSLNVQAFERRRRKSTCVTNNVASGEP